MEEKEGWVDIQSSIVIQEENEGQAIQRDNAENFLDW